MSSQQLAPARLVVTGHTADGKSIFTSDQPVEPFHLFGPKNSGFTYFHSRDSIPVSNVSEAPDLTMSLPRPSPNGLWFGITDFQPKGQAPMHRTLSLDYAVVLSGEIVLGLDGGEEKTIKAGEVIVQRGVNHSWTNRGDVPCRIMFVMAGAEKIVLENGTELEETVFGIGKK
jgi:quercetin dioxygenase-like cupin family protein